MTEFRSGFAAVVGRPNAGKSSLVNALVGQKVAITSARPQTTRHAIRGILHRPDAQLVLVDTPGIHRPRTLLGKRLNTLVEDTLAEVDLILFTTPADQALGPGDRYILQQLAGLQAGRRGPVILAVLTKTDLVPPDAVAQRLLESEAVGRELLPNGFADLVPVSAVASKQLDVLVEVLLSHLPVGPPLYPDGELTDEPAETLVSELVREAALEGVRDELPHSVAVVVDEIVPREDRDDGLLDVRVTIYVERDSQKGIIIGRGGSRLRQIGTASRGAIQAVLGAPVFLDLHVKVAKEWQRDAKQLRRLGF